MTDGRVIDVLERIGSLPSPIVAEVGVCDGVMSEQLLEGHGSLILIMIDDWAAQEDRRAEYLATGDDCAMVPREIQERRFAETTERVARFGDRARITRASSPDCATRFPDASFHLVFLDADHSYSGVSADIRAWWRKVKPGGWLGGHDHRSGRMWEGVGHAVTEFISEIGLPVEFGAHDRSCWFVRKP